MKSPIKGFFGEYRWLSNFWMAPCYYQGDCYPSVEHAYQAAKAVTLEHRNFIAAAKTPKEAKYRSYKIKVHNDWDFRKLDVMRECVRTKFGMNNDLKQMLLNTEDAYLEETNSWNDTFWGVCRDKGENHLGKILMEIRTELQKEIKNENRTT